MRIIALLLVAIVMLRHVGFMVLEMFFWSGPVGNRVFRTTPEFAAASKVLAANQGLYNGFLAAGLIWGLWLGDGHDGWHVKLFFLACVAAAGIYGGWTANRRIFFVQGLPAIIALVLLHLQG